MVQVIQIPDYPTCALTSTQLQKIIGQLEFLDYFFATPLPRDALGPECLTDQEKVESLKVDMPAFAVLILHDKLILVQKRESSLMHCFNLAITPEAAGASPVAF